MTIRVHITPDEDGGYVAECPMLPGCFSQGETREETVRNIAEAVKGYLHTMNEHGVPMPPPIHN